MCVKQNEYTLYVFSDEFLFAAQELKKSKNPAKVAVPSYYLCAHSLELAYKSFLYKKGYTIKRLKKIGHDLEKALKHCTRNGIGDFIRIDDEYTSVVRSLNRYYAKKELEYMTETPKSFPDLDRVKAIVEKTNRASSDNIVTSDSDL